MLRFRPVVLRLVLVAVAALPLSGCGLVAGRMIQAMRHARHSDERPPLILTAAEREEDAQVREVKFLLPKKSEKKDLLQRAQEQAKPETWTPVSKLTPVQSGPGLVVCTPVVSQADAAATEFATGCGRWLELNVAGRPELGRSPLFGSIERARRELRLPDLRLGSDKGLELAKRLGATHVALGTVKGSAAQLELTYQLWDVHTGKPVGTAVHLAGAPKQVLAGLPSSGDALLKQLGVAARVPSRCELSADEARLAGRIPWFQTTIPARSDREALAADAAHSPLLALLALRAGGYRDWKTAVAAAITRTPENALAWGHIGWTDAEALVPHEAALVKARAHRPNSYALAHTAIWLYRTSHRPNLERKAAEQAVRCAPENPDAWLSLGWTTSQVAHELRGGRVWGAMSAKEERFVSAIYDEWQAAVARAAQLDPEYGKAWFRVAEAATFASDRAAAEKAFWKAVQLDRDERDELFEWGLQMFQDKWGGSQEDLQRVATLASREQYGSTDQDIEVAGELKEAGFKDESRTLLDRTLAAAQDAVKQHPADPYAHWDLAYALKERGQPTKALAEYDQVVKMLPKDADARYARALDIEALGRKDDAVKAYREVIALNPRHLKAMTDAAWILKDAMKDDAAAELLRKAIAVDPKDPGALFALGQINFRKKRLEEAVRYWKQAAEVAPYYTDATTRLSSTLAQLKRYDEAMPYARQSVQYHPDSEEAHIALGYLFSMTKQHRKAAAEYRAALEINSDSALAMTDYADAIWELGKKDEARKLWQQVLTMGDAHAAGDARKGLAKAGKT